MKVLPFFEFKDVSFAYPGEKPLYSNVSIGFEKGGFYVVQGPSGVGKSTLLKLMNRMEEPEHGELLYKGQPLTMIPATTLRASIIYIQQTPVVLNGTIRDNLLLPFSFKANKTLNKPEDKKLLHLLSEYSLDNITLDRNANNLSVGQMQRLCLIRGLLLSPEVILFDEPVSSLDEMSSRIVETHAEKLCIDDGKTIVMVTHKEFIPKLVKPRILTVTPTGIISEV